MLELLAAFSGPRGWLVLARNAVPVVGIYALGWSEGACLLDYWFDGASFLAALCAAVAPGVAREVGTGPLGAGRASELFATVFTWALGLAVLGIPFWFSLAFLLQHPALGTGLRSQVFGDPSVWLGLLVVGAANGVEVWRSRIGSMPQAESRRFLHWEFNMLLGRVAVLALLAFFFRKGVVVLVALASSGLELSPLKTLRLLGAPVSEDDVPGRKRANARPKSVSR